MSLALAVTLPAMVLSGPLPVFAGSSPHECEAAAPRAQNDPCFDFGDAPESYGTSARSGGPRHRTGPRLMLGAESTSETGALSADAGDDAVAKWPAITSGMAKLVVPVELTNRGRETTLAGWIDFDGSGTFDGGERAVAEVPAGAAKAELIWRNVPASTEGDTFARLRLFAGEVTDPSPLGKARGGGEMEDHEVRVKAPASAPALHAGKPAAGPLSGPEAHVDCPDPLALVNGSFETPLAPPNYWTSFDQDDVPGWETTATDGKIELWDSGFQGFASADGNQHAELNANQVSTLYQDLPTSPGLTLDWSLFHRGRNGVDTMQVLIGAPGGTLPAQKPDGQTGANIADGKAWGFYTGTYTVPAGQGTTRFAFKSVSAAGGNAAIGNFLDGISFGTPPCLVPEKAVDPASGTAVNEGDTLTYSTEITNHGGNPSHDTVLTDAIPAGTTFVPGSIKVTSPAGATTAVSDATGFDGTRITAGVGSGASGSTGGMVNVGETWAVTFDVTVDEGTAPGPVENTAEVTYRPKPDEDPITTPTETVENPVNVPDVDITKTVDNPDPQPGDTVTYTITAQNVGQAPVDGKKITDDLTGVLDDATYNNDAAATSGAAPSFSEPLLTWTGDIAPGDSVTITYSVTLDEPPGGDAVLINAVTSDIPGSNCPADDPGPQCGTTTPSAALTIVKSSSTDSALAGETVDYTVTIENVGALDYTGAVVTDDLSGVLDDAAYNGDAVATSDDVSFVDPALTWTGDVPAGATVTITYSVTVGSPPGGDSVLKNAVAGPPGSSCERGGRDPGCASEVPVAYLDIAKTSDVEQATAGETATYTVTVTNTGKAEYPAASVSDDLSGVLDDAAYNNDADATSGDVSFADPTLNWSGSVPAGATVTITYSVTVGSPPAGDGVLANAVAGPPGSACEPGSTDPDCGTNVPLAVLDIAKVPSVSSVVAGGTVTYTVTVTSTGTGDYAAAVVSDDLSGVLDDAEYNDDGDATSGEVSFDDPTLRWTGDVPAGETVTITYSVTVDSPPAGDQVLKNAVAGPPGSACEPGSNDPDCVTEVLVAYLDIAKTVEPATAVAGGLVTYTVTVKNTGKAAYAGATVTDDLSGVLDDATFNDDADATSGEVSFADPELTWTGDVPAGGTVVVTYSVTVSRTGAGDEQLDNAVTGPPGSSCGPGSTDPACDTSTLVAGLEIAKSADTTEAEAGDTVRFTITVTNHGRGDYTGAVVSDDLSEVLDDATYDDNADDAGAGGNFTYTEPDLTWTGNVPAGETVTLTYSVTVGNPDPVGDGYLLNVITGPPGSNCLPNSLDEGCWTLIDARREDWGDAPDAYGTSGAEDGPHHQIVPGLELGDGVDADENGDPDPQADSEGHDDATGGFRAHRVGERGYEIDIEVRNDTDSGALLVGWIDFDADGKFDDADRVEVPVPAASGRREYHLAWNDVWMDGADFTFGRLRLYGEVPPPPDTPGGPRRVAVAETGGAEALPTDPGPLGYGGGGEVEDYLLDIRGDGGPGGPGGPDGPGGPGMAVTGTSLGKVLGTGAVLVLLGTGMILVRRNRRTIRG